jgi:hypothetical protein
MERFLRALVLLSLFVVPSRGAEPPPSPLRARIQTLSADLEKSTTVDAAGKEKALALCGEALRQLDAAEASRARAEEYKALAAAAPAAITTEQKRLEALADEQVEPPA